MKTMNNDICHNSLFVATSVTWKLVKDEWKGGDIAPSSNVNKQVKGRVYEHWHGSAHMKLKNNDWCHCLSSGCHIAPGSYSKKRGGRTCEDWCGLVRMKTMSDGQSFIVWLPCHSQRHGTWFRWWEKSEGEGLCILTSVGMNENHWGWWQCPVLSPLSPHCVDLVSTCLLAMAGYMSFLPCGGVAWSLWVVVDGCGWWLPLVMVAMGRQWVGVVNDGGGWRRVWLRVVDDSQIEHRPLVTLIPGVIPLK